MNNPNTKHADHDWVRPFVGATNALDWRCSRCGAQGGTSDLPTFAGSGECWPSVAKELSEHALAVAEKRQHDAEAHCRDMGAAQREVDQS